jgi:histidyl-tRNA synthetase
VGRDPATLRRTIALVVCVGADEAEVERRAAAIGRSPADLRAAGVAARAELGHRKLGKQLDAAAREGAHFAIIVGDELAGGEVQLRDLQAGSQKLVATADLAREVARAHAAHRHGGPDG